MDNNQINPQSGMISTKKLLEYIGAGCAFLGALLGFIFSIVTCSRGATATIKKASTHLVMSYAWIGVLIAVIICIAGIVLLILSKEKGQKLSKLAMIALIVAAVAVVYVALVHITICSYNCTFNNYIDDTIKSYTSSYYSGFYN